MATRTTSGSRIITIIVLAWLLIGLAAAAQRNYFSGSDASCAKVGTTLVTIVAGPLNYVGANPKIDCAAPQPSK
jgi:membrane protein YdbS with pleckstrin-like domain